MRRPPHDRLDLVELAIDGNDDHDEMGVYVEPADRVVGCGRRPTITCTAPNRRVPAIVVEIPMLGTGLSLNVAVVGSLVLYSWPDCSNPPRFWQA